MTEQFSFFDPMLVDGVRDREYNAQEFTDYFKGLVTTGIMKGVGESLKVALNAPNTMVTKIGEGIAYIEGRYYRTDGKTHTHDTEVVGKTRIDRIVVRMDLNPDQRNVLSYVKRGVSADSNPVAPALTQTPNFYEISLAQVKVVGGQTFITAENITDERGKDIICPWAASNILPSYNEDALQTLEIVVNSHINNGSIHVDPPSRTAWDTAFLYSEDLMSRYAKHCITITDWNEAIWNGMYMASGAANAPTGDWLMGTTISHNENWIVQKVMAFTDGHADMREWERSRNNGQWNVWVETSPRKAFTGVVNGKTAIASAISDKGVYTSPVETFANMANNIRLINTGKRFFIGNSYAQNQTGLTMSSGGAIDWTPRLVVVQKVDIAASWLGFYLYMAPSYMANPQPINGGGDLAAGGVQQVYGANMTVGAGYANLPTFSIQPYTGWVNYIFVE